MSKRLLILACLLQATSVFVHAQTLSPDPSTPACPNTILVYTVTDVAADELGIDQSSSGFNTLAGFTDPGTGLFTITASFKDAAATLVLHNFSTGTNTTYKLNVSTLVGVTPKFTVPPQNTPPMGFADVVNIPLCTTTSFNYVGPVTFYQYNGANSGNGMSQYDWLVPSGWSVNGTVCNGTTPITGGVSATITPNGTSGGTMQFWALNNCGSTLMGSNKIKIQLNRTISGGISVGGAGTITVNCGSTSPVTFDVTGTTGNTCITGYQWSAPTGWADASGTPITATFTTTTPSVTLIPQLNVQPSNVSVTLIVNGSVSTANTYTETVLYNATAPTTSISGITPACGAGPFTYTVTGLPAGSGPSVFTVNTLNLTGSITQVTSGNTLTITNPDGAAAGTIQVSASTTTPCGTSVTPIMPVLIGQPAPTIRGFVDGETLAGNSSYTFTMIALSTLPITGWNWIVTPHATISGQNTQTVTFTTPHLNNGQSGSVNMFLTYTTSCGTSATGTAFFIAKAGGVSGFPPPFIRTSAALNEVDIVAGNQVAVDATDDVSGVSGVSGDSGMQPARTLTPPVPGTPAAYTIKSVVVVNVTGQVRKKVIFGGNNSTEHLGLNDLPNGIYFLQIMTSKGSVTEKYMVQH